MRRNRRQKQNVIIKCGEFDYDKLAAAFIKAQKEYDQMVIKETELSDDTCEEKISFWKAVKIIVKNERPTNGTMVSKILASILSVGCNYGFAFGWICNIKRKIKAVKILVLNLRSHTVKKYFFL